MSRTKDETGFRLRYFPHRVLVLLFVLLGVATWRWIVLAEESRPVDWSRPHEIVLVPTVLGAADAGHVAAWSEQAADRLEDWFARELQEWTSLSAEPVTVTITPVERATEAPPALPGVEDGFLPRWRKTSAFLDWFADRAPDSPAGFDGTTLHVLVAPSGSDSLLGERDGVGTRRGRIGVVATGDRPIELANAVAVLAHEALHAMGASDRRDEDGAILHPDGYAEPDRVPLYPQRRAAVMALGIPVAPGVERRVRSLEETTVGARTAVEIGWAELAARDAVVR